MGQCPGMSLDILELRPTLIGMTVLPTPPPGSNTERPDANYRPARQKSVNPDDLPEGYYDASEPPLRTLVIRRLRKIAGAIRPSRDT
jgi:hypothetical protein